MMALLMVMTVISVGMRWIPFLFSKKLTAWKPLEKLSATLPLCIAILLVAHLLHQRHSTDYIPEIGGILAVMITQIWLHQLLLSMSVGIGIHQLLLHLL